MPDRSASISVVLPVYNGAAYLKESIDSVLGQSLAPAEVIVVDDGSTDDTPAIIESFGPAIRSVRQANAGQSSALIVGATLASGAFLAFQDADDLWPARRLELQHAALESDPGLDAVFGLAEQFVSPELDELVRMRLEPPHRILRGVSATCMLIRRATYDSIGDFDPKHRTAYFFDWLSRAETQGLRSLMLDEIVLRRRLHPRNHGRVQAPSRDRDLLTVLRKHIARGRGEGRPPNR